MQRNKSILVICGVLSFMLGFYVKHLIDHYKVLSFGETISWEANPFEFISLFITVLLAIYVTRNLTKRNDKEKLEVDILIKYLIEFKEDLQLRINFISSQDNIEQIKLNSDCKILRKKLHSIITMACENKYLDENEPVTTALRNKLTEVWEILTDTPKAPNPKAPKTVKDGIATLRLDKLNNVENTIIDIEKLIFQMIIKLNK